MTFKYRKPKHQYIPTEYEFTPKFQYRPVEQAGGHDRIVTRNDLSEDQDKALEQLLFAVDSEDVVSLGGYAGTGKSTLIPIISQTLGDTKNTAFCSFTGKASNVLQRKLRAAGIHNPGYVGTIHRLIYSPLTDVAGRIVGWQRKEYPLVADGDTPIYRIIIDEASMINEETLNDLLDFEIPILLVGDHGQLKPVTGSSILSEPDIRLEKIHRQAAGNPIIQLATQIRTEGDIPKNFTACEEIQFVSQETAYEVIGETYERLGLNMAILVRRNVIRKKFNTAPRDIPHPVVGDLVICLKNCAPVFNGMRGLIETIEPYHEHWYKAVVFFPDDGMSIEGLLNRHQFGRDKTIETAYDLQSNSIDYPGAELGLLFDFGIALTVHKSQGSAFDEVILCPEKSSYDEGDDYQRWLYTAVTRAAKKITIVT